MQIFFLPKLFTLILFFFLWPVFQVASALLCLRIDDKWLSYEAPLFKTRSWEAGGKLYKRVFKIHYWKRWLPDGGGLLKQGFKKRRITGLAQKELERFLRETCRSELTHWLAILPFWIFGFFASIEVIFYMLAYALLVNLPCIFAQRYNRPRIVHVLEKNVG